MGNGLLRVNDSLNEGCETKKENIEWEKDINHNLVFAVNRL